MARKSRNPRFKPQTLALLVAIAIIAFAMIFAGTGQTAKFHSAQKQVQPVKLPPDLVPGTVFEYVAVANRYHVLIRAKNIGGGLQIANINIGLEMTADGGDFFLTDSSQCAVLDKNSQRKQDQTVWGNDEYLDCGGVGVASTNQKFTFKVDTTNTVAERNEINNELVVGG